MPGGKCSASSRRTWNSRRSWGQCPIPGPGERLYAAHGPSVEPLADILSWTSPWITSSARARPAAIPPRDVERTSRVPSTAGVPHKGHGGANVPYGRLRRNPLQNNQTQTETPQLNKAPVCRQPARRVHRLVYGRGERLYSPRSSGGIQFLLYL